VRILKQAIGRFVPSVMGWVKKYKKSPKKRSVGIKRSYIGMKKITTFDRFHLNPKVT
jgi:hypothetical protein